MPCGAFHTTVSGAGMLLVKPATVACDGLGISSCIVTASESAETECSASTAIALPVRTLTLARCLPAQGLDDTIVDPGRFRREHLLSLGSQSTVKISSLGGE